MLFLFSHCNKHEYSVYPRQLILQLLSNSQSVPRCQDLLLLFLLLFLFFHARKQDSQSLQHDVLSRQGTVSRIVCISILFRHQTRQQDLRYQARGYLQ